jgi:hypothetical protein
MGTSFEVFQSMGLTAGAKNPVRAKLISLKDVQSTVEEAPLPPNPSGEKIYYINLVILKDVLPGSTSKVRVDLKKSGKKCTTADLINRNIPKHGDLNCTLKSGTSDLARFSFLNKKDQLVARTKFFKIRFK